LPTSVWPENRTDTIGRTTNSTEILSVRAGNVRIWGIRPKISVEFGGVGLGRGLGLGDRAPGLRPERGAAPSAGRSSRCSVRPGSSRR
jgi:hypothetical protein